MNGEWIITVAGDFVSSKLITNEICYFSFCFYGGLKRGLSRSFFLLKLVLDDHSLED